MKKFLFLSMALVLMLSLFSISAMAAETVLSVETPVAMSLAGNTDGNYEYKVTANVTVSADSSAVKDAEVSILMFGNRDNSAFVDGDNVMKLTVEEITSDYNVYYIDQLTSDSNGKVSFDFNVVFPTPAANDLYYLYIGATGVDSATELDLDDLAVSSQIVAVELTSAKTQYSPSENAELSVKAENVFGNTVPADITYSVTKDGVPVENAVNNGVMSCFGLSGNYVINATATPINGGAAVTSDSLTLAIVSAILKGDVDSNGKISVVDAVAVLKHVAGTVNLADAVLDIADFNSDTKVTITDVTAMLKYIARV